MTEFTDRCSCGVPIPPGQSGLCSTCYGDPDWGTDGYLRARLAQQRRVANSQAREAEEAADIANLGREYDPGIG